MADDKNIVKFHGGRTDNFFRPGARIRSITFYGAAIRLVDGGFLSPHVFMEFREPVVEEEAWLMVEKISNGRGFMTLMDNDPIFVPWPPAAIHFEPVRQAGETESHDG
jgi:hypothetical protein